MNVRCPTCKKKTSIPDNEAGLVSVCPACGTNYRVPELPKEPPPLPTAEVVTRGSSRWWLWSLLIFIGLIVLGGVGTGGYFLYQRHLAQENENSAKVAALKAAAEAAIAKDDIKQAQDKLTELEAFVSGAWRPEFQQAVDSVQQGIAARRIADARRAAAPAAPTASAPAVVVAKGKPDVSAIVAPLTQPVAPDEVAVATPSPQTTTPTTPTPSTQPAPTDGPYPTTAPVVATAAAPKRPPVKIVPEPPDQLTDAKIGASITRGITFLLSRFDPKTHLIGGAAMRREDMQAGLDILCVYALMQAQEATNDPRLNPHDDTMKGLIDAMKKLNLNNYHFETYSRGLRATALALYNRPEDKDVLGQDALALAKGSHLGGYTYELAKGNAGANDSERYDNSNSQYGLLGVWSAAEVGFEVSDVYWNMVQHHWMSTQLPDGQWPYHRQDEGRHSMTCAGLASLFVTHDYLDVPKFGTDVGRDPFTPSLARGLAWMERGNNATALSHGAYDLYGLERVGLASGFKFFGTHEWYREMALQEIARQQKTGGWGGDVETAYTLLFLARGRHPILMNKVRFDGYWANRPRDVANLARFVGYQLERPLNWQVVPLARNFTDWMDSPILYISSHKEIKISDADYDKIRSFVENGGLLFMQADGAASEFNRFARTAAHKLFPDYEMTLLPSNHPLCSTVFKIKPNGHLHIVTNGARILMLYSDEDLSKSWQMRDDKNKPFPFQLGTNMFIYAAGKRDLRNHINSTYIPAVADAPTATFRIARLKYPGNWNPEPAAWPRFSRWFHINTGYQLEVVETPIKELTLATAPIAELTGNARYDLTAEESAAIKAYVNSGGVLLVDMCGGEGAFDKSVQTTLYFREFAATPSRVMSVSNPMLTASANGMEEISKPRIREFAMDALGTHAGMPEEIVSGKGHIIYTYLDITTGLLGTNTWGIMGYDANYAQSLVKNAILWTIDGQHDEAPMANR